MGTLKKEEELGGDVSVRMKKELYIRLREHADRRGMSVTPMLSGLIYEWCENEDERLRVTKKYRK